MKHFSLFALILLLLIGCSSQKSNDSIFRLHLFQEPLHLDPALMRGSSASYFFYNTLRGLYRYDAAKGLTAEGGQCLWTSPTNLACQLNDYQWSDGSLVTSADYIRSFQHLVSPQTASPRADLLIHVKNAREIMSGQSPIEKIGVRAHGPKMFTIEFSKPDPEFLYKLTSTALLPRHKNHQSNKKFYKNFIVNGPYKIKQWFFGQKVVLEPNPYYKKGHLKRPMVEMFFIDDEMTAYRLYNSKHLSFLRRVPTQMIPVVQTRTDFFQVPMARFDYIGFGPELQKNKKLRKALAYSINYDQLTRLLHSLGRTGCPSLPHTWMDELHCHPYKPTEAKKLFDSLSKKVRNKVYQLKVSQLGGNDIKKQAEFLQHQWQSLLGLKVEISQLEQRTFINELRTQPPDIFRKGVGLDIPTCSNGLKTFLSDNSHNFMKLSNNNYAQIVKKMAQTSSSSEYKKMCSDAIAILMANFSVIPLGEMHFSLMAHPEFQGWSLNAMNQLDLSQLHPKKAR